MNNQNVCDTISIFLNNNFDNILITEPVNSQFFDYLYVSGSSPSVNVWNKSRYMIYDNEVIAEYVLSENTFNVDTEKIIYTCLVNFGLDVQEINHCLCLWLESIFSVGDCRGVYGVKFDSSKIINSIQFYK